MTKIGSKLNGSYKYGCYHIGRTNLWGWYCLETGECYLAHDTGEYTGVLASAELLPDGTWQEQSAWGHDCEVVRELLRLGHLTKKTLTNFIEAGGEIWWDQPTK